MLFLCIPGSSVSNKTPAINLRSGVSACAPRNKYRANHFPVALFFLFILCAASCSQPDKDAGKDVYNNLELNGRINTFPLNIILSDKLSGNEFPDDLKQLCSFSKQTCKTLPIAGILRSGADIYYTYNCFADLKVPGSSKTDEAGITEAVEKQVNTYYSTTKTATFDSLLTPNLPEWNIQNFAQMYVSNSSDSVFFYSSEPGFPDSIQVGNRSYIVYKNVQELRREIDNIICKSYVKIAVFYNPVSGEATSKATEPRYASRGKRAGDSCVQTSRYEKLSDGTGGFMLGKLLDAKSTACGFIAAAPAVTKPAVLPPAVTKPAVVPPADNTASDSRVIKKRLNPVRSNTTDDEILTDATTPPTDNRTARRSEPVCEQDQNKNYTGRRVQYFYNKEGKIIRTVVISKCEADCRCF